MITYNIVGTSWPCVFLCHKKMVNKDNVTVNEMMR